MKKLMIVLLSVLLLVGCDPSGNERPGAIKLNGNTSITLTVGDTYTELGAYVDGDDTITVTVSGTVDTSVADTYEITYSYVHEGVTISKKRTVIVEEFVLADILLNGDATITLTVGDTYQELGAYVDGDTTIEVTKTGTVNTSVAGTYTLTYSYEVDGVTKSCIRTVIVEEQTTVSCSLDGQLTIDLELGGTYTEPGFTCTPNTTTVVVDSSSLDTSTEGTYTITYTYNDGTTDIVLTRSVRVIDMNITFTLNGESSLIMNQNETWTDPGYTITPSQTQVIVTDTVDTAVPGVYEVKYEYYDDSELVTISRFVEVIQTVFYEFTGSTLVDDTLTVNITGKEPNNKYFTFDVVLYKDDVIMDTKAVVDGQNTLTFNYVVEGHIYKLEVVGAYYEGSAPTPSYDKHVLDTFEIEIPIEVPEIVISNEAIGIDSYGFDYSITDPDSRFLWIDVILYDGDTVINDSYSALTATSGTILIGSLIDYKEYRIEVLLTYDEGTTNIQTNPIDKVFETELEFSFVLEVEHDLVFKDHSNKLIVHLNNPNAYTIDSIYFDGVLQTFSVIDSLTIHIDLDTSVVGEFTQAINIIKLDVRDEIVGFPYDEEFTYEVVDELAPENVPYVVNYFSNDDEYDTRSGGEGHTMQLELHNPLQLEIKDIYLDGKLLQDIYVYTNDGQTITFYDHFSYHENKNRQIVTKFTYVFGGVDYEVEVDSFNVENIPLCETGLIQVSTVQDVKDMVTSENLGLCYELVNDIDLSGENWVYELGTGADRVVLFGNNFTISNVTMTYSDIVSGSDTYWGLFRSLYSSHIQDLNITYSYNLGNSNNGKMFIGGLAGYMYNTHLENVNVSGSINSNWYTNGYVGGLVGFSASNFMEDIEVSTSVAITQYTPTVSSVLGSMIGEAMNTEIHGYIESTSISVTGVTTHANLTVGDPIALETSNNIKEIPGT